MMRRALCITTVFCALVAAPATFAEDAGTFAGKTITLIVGFGPGGGYDLYARLLAHHLAAHVPGNPNVVVQNMEGAGGIRAANYVYANAPKDGTFVAAVNQGAALFAELGGRGAAYDPTKLQWLGRLASSNNVVITMSATGVHTIADAKASDVSMAGSGIISDADIYPKVLNALVGTRFKIINGYGGTSESYLAMERGEVDGRGGGAYSSLVSLRPQWLRDKTISVLVQVGFDKEPDLPNVPLLLDLVSSEEEKQIATLVTLPVAIGYTYWVAPGVPDARVGALRKALDDAAHDPALLAEAKAHSLEIRYKGGADLQAMVRDAAATPKSVLTLTARILGW